MSVYSPTHPDADRNCIGIASQDTAYETVVGDEKQAAFYPRIKVKTWDNKVNFSVGVIDDNPGDGQVSIEDNVVVWAKSDVSARFYGIPPTPPARPVTLRYAALDVVGPTYAQALYDAPWQADRWQPRLTTFRLPPSVMYFGAYQADAWIDTAAVDVPESRLGGLPGANPMYADEGLYIVDLYHANLIPGHVEAWTKAMKEVLAQEGLTVYHLPDKGPKLFFSYQGRDIKCCSPQTMHGHMASYLNWDCNYDRIYDFYAGPTPAHDAADVGLRHVLPDADPQDILRRVVERFAAGCSLELDQRPVAATESEQRLINDLQVVHADPQWIRHAHRADADWHFRPIEEQAEFEYILQNKPASNVIEFSIKTKGLQFFKQPATTHPGELRPPHIIDSYAAYYDGVLPGSTGKAFHLYRPLIIAADGAKSWADMDIDTDRERLTITIPQQFVDTAAYPLLIDPTFGYTSMGASIIANAIYGLFATPATSGSVNAISAYTSDDGKVASAIYDTHTTASFDVSNLTKMTQSVPRISPDGGGRVDTYFAPVAVTAGHYYVLAFHYADSYGGICYDTGTNVCVRADDELYDSATDTFPAILVESSSPARDYRLSVFAHSSSPDTGFMPFFS